MQSFTDLKRNGKSTPKARKKFGALIETTRAQRPIARSRVGPRFSSPPSWSWRSQKPLSASIPTDGFFDQSDTQTKVGATSAKATRSVLTPANETKTREESPRCVNYIQVPGHPDNDTSPLHGGHRRSHVWIYIVAVLLFAILMVALCMCWRSRQPQQIGPTILDRSLDEPVAPLAEGPIGHGRRLSSAAGLMHEKDMELDQAFLNRIGHRSGTVHRTERLWGNNTVVVQPPLVGPGLRSANEDRVNNGFDIADVSPPAPTLEPAHEHPVVTFAPIKPSTDSPK